MSHSESSLRDSWGHLRQRLEEYHSEPQKGPYQLVREFHEVFGHPVAGRPAELDSERLELRLELIREEFCEVLEAAGYTTLAYAIRDLEMAADGEQDLWEMSLEMADLIYVVNGMAIEAGINLPLVVDAVHKSNMSKLSEDGTVLYREDGKVLKGPNYVKPDISGLFEEG